jgi:hypothetical protein
MMHLFLSASVPLPDRDPRYHDTADVIAIRDAVRALTTTVLPHAQLHWGGHPSITPLIKAVAQDVGLLGTTHVHLYQSEYFRPVMPEENDAFEQIVFVPAGTTRESSLEEMRRIMMTSVKYDAAIFIGGMEGVEDEFKLFRSLYPDAPVYPVASTGAAARVLYERDRKSLDLPVSLSTDYAYASMFRDVLAIPRGIAT